MLPWKETESIFLTYPKDYCRTVDRSDETRDLDSLNEGKRPLVIILAWTSAIERHMRLYSKIFEDEGYITLISICPVMVAFWHQDIMHEIAQKLVNTIEENNLYDNPTIIQLFSNGGAMQYEFFMKALKRNRKFLNVKGVIFDSLPAKTNFRNYFKAIHIMRGGTSEAKSALMTASLFTGWRMRNFFRYIINRDFFVWDSWEYLKNEENISPQHFIYSRADAVTPYQCTRFACLCSEMWSALSPLGNFPLTRLQSAYSLSGGD
ncbi:hypothetical protein WA026_016795 [Henosepilachna vigintioctopunctata]|uniref:Transmembrane protein 53 n=1 Tax=Henosepilachna vigintioctopunctata TaxID=420089 RepID=A0AAW1V2K0_9CUCU